MVLVTLVSAGGKIDFGALYSGFCLASCLFVGTKKWNWFLNNTNSASLRAGSPFICYTLAEQVGMSGAFFKCRRRVSKGNARSAGNVPGVDPFVLRKNGYGRTCFFFLMGSCPMS